MDGRNERKKAKTRKLKWSGQPQLPVNVYVFAVGTKTWITFCKALEGKTVCI